MKAGDGFCNRLGKMQKEFLDLGIAEVIENVGLANDITELKAVKKLVGFKYAYRIKMGKYRIGFFYQNDIVEFARIVHRKDIYKVFP